jgi:hypothetical protein
MRPGLSFEPIRLTERGVVAYSERDALRVHARFSRGVQNESHRDSQGIVSSGLLVPIP